jgi:hypothetical protein
VDLDPVFKRPKNVALRLVDSLTVKEAIPLDEDLLEAGSDAEPEYRVVTDGFFRLNQLCIVVGVLWLVLMWKTLKKLRDEPLSAWTVFAAAPSSEKPAPKKNQ